MRLKLTLFLFFSNLLVFGWIIYLERADRDAGRALNPELLLAAEAAEIDRLEIRGPALERPRVLTRSPRVGWMIEEPLVWPANENAVLRILDQLQLMRADARISVKEIREAGQTLADYGLESPTLILGFSSKEAPLTEVRIGAPTEIGNRLYLLGPDATTISVIPNDLLGAVSISLADLRDPAVFQIPFFEVRELVARITREGDLTLRLARDGDRWQFITPLETAADPQAVNATIQELTSLRATNFFPEGSQDPATTGLASPSLRLTLEGNNRRQTLLVGEARTENNRKAYYAQLADRPTLVTVPAGPLDQLLAAQVDWREKRFLLLEPETLTGIAISNAGRTIRLRKGEAGVWRIVTGQAEDGGRTFLPADPARMDALIDGFRQLEARDFVNDAPSESNLRDDYGLADPQWTVTFESGDTETRLLLGDFYQTPEGRNRIYARTGDASFVYGVDVDVTRLLQTRALAYRERLLQDLPDGARITRLRLTRIGEDRPLVEIDLPAEAEARTQAIAGAFDSEARQAAFQTLVDTLPAWPVDRFLSNRFSVDGFGGGDAENPPTPWHFLLEETILLPGGSSGDKTETRRFYLSERLEARFQAVGSPESGLVAVLGPATIEALHTLTFDREPSPEHIPPEPMPTSEKQPLPPEPGDEETGAAPDPEGAPATVPGEPEPASDDDEPTASPDNPGEDSTAAPETSPAP
ncbi:MAG: DUF4340 domain-containing protein [Opitutales bacterium]